ncbi:MAG: LexA family protein [Anaerolineae bacterium]
MTGSPDAQTLRVFRFVRDYIREHSIAPSQREIAQGTFMATTTMVLHLTRLEMLRWLYRDYNIPRSIRLDENAPDDTQFEQLWQTALNAEEETL